MQRGTHRAHAGRPSLCAGHCRTVRRLSGGRGKALQPCGLARPGWLPSLASIWRWGRCPSRRPPAPFLFAANRRPTGCRPAIGRRRGNPCRAVPATFRCATPTANGGPAAVALGMAGMALDELQAYFVVKAKILRHVLLASPTRRCLPHGANDGAHRPPRACGGGPPCLARHLAGYRGARPQRSHRASLRREARRNHSVRRSPATASRRGRPFAGWRARFRATVRRQSCRGEVTGYPDDVGDIPPCADDSKTISVPGQTCRRPTASWS